MSVVVSLESPHCSCPYHHCQICIYSILHALWCIHNGVWMISIMISLQFFDDCNSSWGQHLLRMDQRPGPLPPLPPRLLFLQLRIPHLSEVATAIGWHLVFHNPPQVVHLAEVEPPMLMLRMAMVPEIPVMPTVPVMAGMEATPVRILVVFQLAALVDVGFLLEALEAHKLQLVAFGDQEILLPSEVLHLEHSRLRRPSTIVKHISMRSWRDLQIFWGLEAECYFVAKGQHFR